MLQETRMESGFPQSYPPYRPAPSDLTSSPMKSLSTGVLFVFQGFYGEVGAATHSVALESVLELAL